jgi:uncharacterized membrane protein
MKRVLFILCGICWFMFGLGFAFFLLQYVAQGAGLQDLGPIPIIFGQPITSGSVLMGLMEGTGLFLAAVFCFVVGVGLCSHGLASRGSRRLDKELPEKKS